MMWLGVIALSLACAGAGMALGWHLRERTQRDWRDYADSLERIIAADETPRRRPGQPTNADGPRARVTDGRIRKGARWTP